MAPNTGATLLEQAEAAGLTPEFGCRMGICFSCVAKKPRGHRAQRADRRGVRRPDEEIRICVSTPVGDCAVDL